MANSYINKYTKAVNGRESEKAPASNLIEMSAGAIN
jgi:hypothetical protein